MEPRLYSEPRDLLARQVLLERLTGVLQTTIETELMLECDEELEAVDSGEETRPVATGREEIYDEFYTDLCQTDLDWTTDPSKTLHHRYSVLIPGILLDWLCEVCSDYHLRRETYYLAVSLTNRFLTQTEVAKSELQLVAIGALSLAAKAEESTALSLFQLGKSCKGAYGQREIRAIERRIVSVLGWKVCVLTPVSVLFWMMARWEEFLARKFVHAGTLPPDNWPSFLCSSLAALLRFQRAFWVLDALQLHPQLTAHPPFLYTAAVFYLSVCHAFQESGYALLVEKGGERDAMGLCEGVEELFGEFLRGVGGGEVRGLDEEVAFLVPFFNLMAVCEFPAPASPDPQEMLLITSRQNHFPFTLQYVSYLLKSHPPSS